MTALPRPDLPTRRRRPRLADFAYKGEHAYHVVLSTHEGRHTFSDLAFGERAAKILDEVARQRSFGLLAYAFMPNHAHLLVQGKDDSADLIRFVQLFKQRTGFEYRKLTGLQLWRQSFFDRVLRQEESIEIVATYVFGNPVRAGLCANGADYVLSGGEWFEMIADGARGEDRGSEADGAEAPSVRVPRYLGFSNRHERGAE